MTNDKVEGLFDLLVFTKFPNLEIIKPEALIILIMLISGRI
jgi:hypothetical protein